jgi:hypothetical protein
MFVRRSVASGGPRWNVAITRATVCDHENGPLSSSDACVELVVLVSDM